MKKYFVSYHFGTPGGNTGFGDYNVDGEGIFTMDDIVAVKKIIIDYLAEKQGILNATVVILNWQQFEVPPE
jgi:hypothetical protein